jgi:hypothetical protein
MPTENTVAKALIAAGLARGFTVSIQDGEEWTVKRSRDANEAFKALFTTGEDRVLFRDEAGIFQASFYLVAGNEPNGEELIADHTDNPIANELYREVMVAQGFEQEQA